MIVLPRRPATRSRAVGSGQAVRINAFLMYARCTAGDLLLSGRREEALALLAQIPEQIE